MLSLTVRLSRIRYRRRIEGRKPCYGTLSNARLLRTQPYTRLHSCVTPELDGGGAKSFGDKCQRVVAPFFIADDGHFLDMLTFLHHEAHIAPVLLPLPSFERFGNDQPPDFSLPRDRFLRNLDDPVIVSLLELPRIFICSNFPEASIISTGMVIISFYPSVFTLVVAT
jgi:hypothetical protein